MTFFRSKPHIHARKGQPSHERLRTHASGFTLVETLVAITILLIAILAPMRIISQSIKSAIFSREQLTAVFLAQESIEAIWRARDNDALNNPATTWTWYSSLPAACRAAGTGCSYNPQTDTFVACTASAACPIYFDEDKSSGTYYSNTSSGGVATPFSRRMTVSQTTTGEVSIVSEVYWNSVVLNDAVSLRLESRIFDQYE